LETNRQLDVIAPHWFRADELTIMHRRDRAESFAKSITPPKSRRRSSKS
jgi:hypothetical protein